MIISFAWTTPALLAGAKTMTRRDWSPEYAARFHVGDLVDAWNRSPRVGRAKGARRVATIRLARDPYQQFPSEMLRGDFIREGFEWLEANGYAETVAQIREDWRDDPHPLWVVEFELVEVLP